MTVNLTDMVQTSERERAVIRTGVVVSFGSGMLVVSVGGSNVRAGYLASYGPTVGDEVAVALQDASWLVLGRVVGG